MNIPPGHQTVMPYLILPNARGFADFVQAVFRATLGPTTLRDDDTTIMHGEVKIGESTLMFAEATDQWAPQPASLFVYVENTDETYQLALAQGATSVMEPADRDYGRSGGVADPFGNSWWITSL
ncbi:VOC family protein [Rhabdobacter roseus]|uniref:Putative glyoxalase superfamily protein PhnB n=1 Tax=Rhabdobacter roseus TaxID=1655419 RepID=A0A840U0T4_9BACT|nr:VOC family protein [Rhabdobacter roseus]MBB5287183.1 putative glyoxalase superfamily protein PhnB [Rhabdobacter roseus]